MTSSVRLARPAGALSALLLLAAWPLALWHQVLRDVIASFHWSLSYTAAELGPCLAQAGTVSGDVVDLTPEAAGRLRTAILHLPTGSEEAILRSKAPNYGRGDHRCAAYVVHLRAADRLGRSTQADDLSSVRRLDARPGCG